MAVKKALKKQAVASVAIMGLGASLGLPLFLLIPIVLLAIGVGIYVIVTLMPFIIAGIVFIAAFLVARVLKIGEPWKLIIPIIAAVLALFPYFVHSLSLSMASVSSSVSGASFPGVSMTSTGVLEILMFVILLALSIWLSIEKDNGKPLGAMIVSLILLLALFSAAGASAGASTLAVDGAASAAGFDSLVVVLPLAIVVVLLGYRMDWFD